MAFFQRRLINWTNTARIQLVEAVIKVEGEIMNESNRSSRGPSGKQMGVNKWSRIASLLPCEFQGKVWSRRGRKFGQHKCERIFVELLRAFRDKLAGKNTRYSRRNMTVPLWELLKRRDDLLKARTSIEAENRLISGRSNRVTAITSSRNDQLELSPTGNSVLGSVGANTRIQWTETARLLLIKAVIQVEQEDLRNNADNLIRSSNDRLMGKWDRITSLLPAELRARTNHQHLYSYSYKCRYVFVNLLSSYRARTRKGPQSPIVKGPQSRLEYRLSKPVYKMMKEREDLWNPPIPIPAQSSLKSGSSNRFGTRTRSANDERQLSAKSSSFRKVHTNHGRSSERWSTASTATGTATRAATQPAASFLSEHTNGSTRAAEALGFDTSAAEKERNHINYGESMETNTAGSSLGYTSRSSGEFMYPESQNRPASLSKGPDSRSISDPEEPEHMAKPSARPGVQTRTQTRAKYMGLYSCTRPPCTRPPSNDFQAPGFQGESFTSMSNYTSHDENLLADMDGLRTRIELEFSRLSSWVQSPSIRQMTTSAFRSCVMDASNGHCFAEATEPKPFDKLLQRSLSRKLEYQIRAAFQKLRAQFAEDLKNTSRELADEVLQDTNLFYIFTRRG